MAVFAVSRGFLCTHISFVAAELKLKLEAVSFSGKYQNGVLDIGEIPRQLFLELWDPMGSNLPTF
jgi:hypothetical protein